MSMLLTWFFVGAACVWMWGVGGQRAHVWKPEVDDSPICFSALVFEAGSQ